MTDEVFICDDVRTPIGRYGGALARVRTDDLAALPIRELARRHPGLAAAVEDVFYGAANQAGEDNRNVARMAALLAGLPRTVPGVTLNRLCASGMDAVGAGGAGDPAGEIESRDRRRRRIDDPRALRHGQGRKRFPRIAEIVRHHDRLALRQPDDERAVWRRIRCRETAENVADEFAVSRADQDAFALRSQQRAAAAQASGCSAARSSPVELSDARASAAGRARRAPARRHDARGARRS